MSSNTWKAPADVYGPVAVDTETSGLFVDDGCRVSTVSIAYRNKQGELVSMAYNYDQGPLPDKDGGLSGTLFDEWEAKKCLPQKHWDALLKWLSKQQLIFHNAKFDLHMLMAGTRKWGGVDLEPQFIWDTQLAAYIMDPLHSTSLKPTAARLWGEEEKAEQDAVKVWLRKHGHSRDGRYDLVPWDVIGPYAAKDTELTYRLWEHQTERIDQGESFYMPYIEREFEFCRVLLHMERRGVGFDVGRCNEAAKKMAKARNELGKKLPFDPKRAKAYFFEELGVIPYKVTEKRGDPVLDKDVLRRLVDDGVENAKAYQEYQQLEHSLSMWYEAWPRMCGEDGRLRTSYRQTKQTDDYGKERGTVTGRLAVERVQLQAIPHDHQLPPGVESVRKMFIPKPGHQLWELDFSQAELRVAAAIANCQGFIEIFEQGQDAHDGTATRIFGVKEGDDDWFEKRQIAKRLNFAMLYGAGARTLVEQIRLFTGINVSMDQVDEWLAQYKYAFPELGRTSRKAQRLAEQRGYVKLVTGRQRWFKPMEPTHKALNAIIQGNVAEAMKIWMIGIEGVRMPERLLLQIHDSVTLELPEETAQDEVAFFQQFGAQTFSHLFKGLPFKVDAKQWK